MAYGLSELLRDWIWLVDLSDYTLLAISPFGDLLLRDKSAAVSLLDINLGALEPATESGTDPVKLFPMAFDDAIAAGYREAGLFLTDGTCYGYKRQLVAGAPIDGENVYVATLTEYLSFMGSFHEQIQDVADGETVMLDVINQRIIQ
jgi:hypothetical protein